MLYKEIGDLYQVSIKVIYNRMKKFNINSRPRSEIAKTIMDAKKLYINKEELAKVVAEGNQTTPEIAKYFNTNADIIRARCKEYNISLKKINDYSRHKTTMILMDIGTGSKNPNWKGGITSLREIIRKHRKSKNWTRTCLERDKFTCQKCSKIGGKLQVDHIRPFSFICDKNNIFSLEKALECHY